MRDKDLEPKFSWTLAFFVTGISFLIFCKVLEMINDNYPVFFLWIGITALVAGCIAGLVSLVMKSKNSSHQQIDQ
jgi:hypothetical protein